MAPNISTSHSEALWDTVWHSDGTVGDWDTATPEEITNVGGLQNLDNLGTAIILALFTNARLPDGMVGRDGWTADDQHEWHGNTFNIEGDEDAIGSYLYLIERKVLTDEVAKEAVHYCSLTMSEFIRRGYISSFYIEYEIDKPNGRLNLLISVLISGTGETQIYQTQVISLL